MKITRIGSVVICLVGLAINTLAVPITFTHTGVGSGSIGNLAFSQKEFTLTALGDTATRIVLNPGAFGYSIDHASASITISGFGSFNLLSASRTFVNNSASIVGFSRGGNDQTDLFNGPTHASLSSWNMLSSIGPLNGSGSLLQWSSPSVMTDGGILNFQSTSTSVTFQAVVVPEPGCGVLLLIGLGAAFQLRRRAIPKTL